MAEYVRVVQDNLNTHTPGALYEAFPPEEARRILRRLQFHYTPKHASWLNMAEIEIGIFQRSCLQRRLGDAAAPESAGGRPPGRAQSETLHDLLAIYSWRCPDQTAAPLPHNLTEQTTSCKHLKVA